MGVKGLSKSFCKLSIEPSKVHMYCTYKTISRNVSSQKVSPWSICKITNVLAHFDHRSAPQVTDICLL